MNSSILLFMKSVSSVARCCPPRTAPARPPPPRRRFWGERDDGRQLIRGRFMGISSGSRTPPVGPTRSVRSDAVRAVGPSGAAPPRRLCDGRHRGGAAGAPPRPALPRRGRALRGAGAAFAAGPERAPTAGLPRGPRVPVPAGAARRRAPGHGEGGGTGPGRSIGAARRLRLSPGAVA